MLGSALLAISLTWPAVAQDVPNYLAHQVPTAPNPAPLSTQRPEADYLANGYDVVLRTHVAGRFEGCRAGNDLAFEDGSRFRCGATFFHVETYPPVLLLRKLSDGTHILLIGGHPVAGRLNEIRGVKLTHAIPLGNKVYGVPKDELTERRTIGPVDATNGEIAVIPQSRSFWYGSTRELSTWPSSMPPAETSLNPTFRDEG